MAIDIEGLNLVMRKWDGVNKNLMGSWVECLTYVEPPAEGREAHSPVPAPAHCLSSRYLWSDILATPW